MIRLENVCKQYGEKETLFYAIKDVNLEIETSKMTVIIGQSGSGKTTLLNLIGAIDSLTSGNIYIDDKNINNLSQKELCEFRNKNIGYIFQSFFLDLDYTVLENVVMPLVIAGVSKKEREERAKEIIDRLGLLGKINQKAKNLSGGERQRVSIARALVSNPKIILADEPTGALDETNGDDVINILKSLTKNNITVILVTHNLKYTNYADKVVTIKDGKIL